MTLSSLAALSGLPAYRLDSHVPANHRHSLLRLEVPSPPADFVPPAARCDCCLRAGLRMLSLPLKFAANPPSASSSAWGCRGDRSLSTGPLGFSATRQSEEQHGGPFWGVYRHSLVALDPRRPLPPATMENEYSLA